MEGRNKPMYVKYVAEKIAKIKKLSYEEIACVTTENAKKLFKIKEENIMKIAIAGSHGVGKTTFAKALAEKLGCTYIPDIVREEAVPKGFVINEKTPPEVQLWLVSRQWELETTTPEDWVVDKSLFDYIVYGELVLRDEKVKQVIRDIVRRNARYDFIFFLPIEFPMEQDGIRSADIEFQKNIEQRFKECLSEFEAEYIMLSGSVEERVNRALSHIKK